MKEHTEKRLKRNAVTVVVLAFSILITVMAIGSFYLETQLPPYLRNEIWRSRSDDRND